jgi:hypothetical protein
VAAAAVAASPGALAASFAKTRFFPIELNRRSSPSPRPAASCLLRSPQIVGSPRGYIRAGSLTSTSTVESEMR